jgi:hypothetical protein
MGKQSVSLVLCSLGIGAAVAVACSSPDPGVNYAVTPPVGSNDAGGSAFTGNGSSSGGVTSGSSSGTPTMSQDAGSPTSTGDASTGGVDGGDAGGGSADAGGPLPGFLGETSAFDASMPTPTAFQSHAAQNPPIMQQTPTLDCLACHTNGGAGVPFLAAGFVATAAGGTTGAAGAEVRVYAQGTTPPGFSTHTDANGYFWINPPVGGATGPYQAGVRNGSGMQIMPVTQTMADCQSASCHGGGQGVVHL